ncbi:MAG: hypothetical protein U9Q95_02760, partial [Candidatus Eisenbacteria bacterium]|nr:hypothetical protein [Candidatus Eisenbacteria bacterium]
DAAVTGPKLGTAAVATDKLEDAAVTGPKLGTAAVATDKLEDAAVTGSKLGTAAVATDKLEDAAVTGAKLGTAAVATDKLEDAAVTGAKLGPAAVTTDKLEDAAVTGAKIADQSVEFVDLAQGGALHGDVMKWSDARVGWKAAPDSVGIVDVIAGDGLTETGMGGSGIVTLSVDFAGTGSATTVPRSDHDHDANYVEEGQVDAISGAMILDGSVDSADIQDSAVTSAKIADATIGLADVAQNGAIEGQVMKWSEPGGSWVVADDESGSGGSTGWVDDGAVVRLETVSDSVGIGTSSPQARLDVVGALRTEAFEMPTGAGSGYVLMSDATGAGSWQVSPGGMGGSGVAEYVPVFTSPTTLGASVIHQSADGLIGIGTTTGTSTVTISGSASEAPVSILYSGTANPEHILSLERTNVPPPYSKMLVLREPSGLSIYSSFIQCRRGSDTEFSVDGDGSVHVNASTDRAGEFTTDCDTTHSTYAVYGEYTGTGDINARGVYGKSVPMDGWGYGGEFLGGDSGVVGRVDPTGSGTYRGVYGRVEGGSGRNYGVYGHAYGSTHTNYGVYGSAHDGTSYAGYFAGDTHVNGTLSKSAGSFRIDHPLDPANKYLSHSFVESPDMMNVYNGNVVLDSNGEAVVVLPEWFEALNRDFRYQLTCIGGFAPVYVSEELAGNRFSIAGGTPGLKVSWQLTGIRHDRFAEEHRIIVEEEKRPPERGKYLHPELYGQPEELTLHRAEPPE